ncbi:uncharacterized protein LOC144481659 [Mustelus asterias]
MKSVALLLLVCICARELDATRLNDEVLRRIVKDFHDVRQNGTDQFSFLIALKPKQCKTYTADLYTNHNITSGQPRISTNTDDFQEKVNYIAVYPDAKCSEYKIFFNRRENKWLSVWFGEQVGRNNLLQGGGCVIFYTEKTPCTVTCHTGKHFIDVMAPLKERPFIEWRSDKSNSVHKYFVYGELSNCNTDRKERIIHRFECLDEGECDANGSFLFRKCEENKACETCNRQNHYCVN